jgi:hypothetical protein
MAGKCLACVLLFAVVGPASGREPDIKEPTLRQELLDMQKADQEAKAGTAALLQAKGLSLRKAQTVTDPTTFKLLAEEASKTAKVDRNNRTRLRKIVDKYGWPGKSLVDTDGSEAAVYLALQAQKDVALQKRCLKAMKDAPKGEVEPAHVAQLTDTVLIAEKKKQLYGTGLQAKNGVLKPYPIEDEANLDKRRSAIGLPPLADYLEKAQQQYDAMTGKK